MKRVFTFTLFALLSASAAIAQLAQIPAGSPKDKAVTAIERKFQLSDRIVREDPLTGYVSATVEADNWTDLLEAVLKPDYQFTVVDGKIIITKKMVTMNRTPSKPGRPTLTVHADDNDRPATTSQTQQSAINQQGQYVAPNYYPQLNPAPIAAPYVPTNYYPYSYGSGYGYGNYGYAGGYYGWPLFDFQLREMQQVFKDHRTWGLIKFKGVNGCDNKCLQQIEVKVVINDRELKLVDPNRTNNWYERPVLVPVNADNTVMLRVLHKQAGTTLGEDMDLILPPMAISGYKAKDVDIDPARFKDARELRLLQQHVKVETAPGKFESKPPSAIVIK